MGRVEEAMRRAGNRHPGTEEPAASPAEMSPGAQGTAPVADLFPHESPERPRLRSVSPAADLSARPKTKGLDAEIPSKAPASSLFERLDGGLSGKTVVDIHTDGRSREQYRRLAATLHAAQADRGLKVIMIISAMASEGKSLTATNLALTFSESYRRNVLLIDGDLRKPSLHTLFNLNASPGLSEGLMSIDERKLSLHRVSAGLTVLTAGQPNSDPMAALASDRATRLIEEARQTFDWVIIDTPPVGLLSDASLLADAADGAVLVIKAGVTPHEQVQRAVAAIGRERLLGVVLNRAARDASGMGSKYYDYYQPGSPSGGQSD